MKNFLLIFIIIEIFYPIFTQNNISESSSQMNVGTTLFTDLDISKQCWARDHVALLSKNYIKLPNMKKNRNIS